MHVLHAIHDFLPRHQAGSELYALRLARAQMERHDVTVLCADFDPSGEHGHVHWRMHEGVPVVEIINNWRCASFEETYRSRLMGDRIRHVLRDAPAGRRPRAQSVEPVVRVAGDG